VASRRHSDIETRKQAAQQCARDCTALQPGDLAAATAVATKTPPASNTGRGNTWAHVPQVIVGSTALQYTILSASPPSHRSHGTRPASVLPPTGCLSGCSRHCVTSDISAAQHSTAQHSAPGRLPGQHSTPGRLPGQHSTAGRGQQPCTRQRAAHTLLDGSRHTHPSPEHMAAHTTGSYTTVHHTHVKTDCQQLW
jgi:hypothetical protein